MVLFCNADDTAEPKRTPATSDGSGLTLQADESAHLKSAQRPCDAK